MDEREKIRQEFEKRATAQPFYDSKRHPMFGGMPTMTYALFLENELLLLRSKMVESAKWIIEAREQLGFIGNSFEEQVVLARQFLKEQSE